MSISMVVIVVGVLVLVAFQGGFSFSPGKPSGGTAPSADVQAGFATAGRTAKFPAVVPKGIPAGWRPSSFTITPAPGTPDTPPTVRGGWQTPSGGYVTLIESSGQPDAVANAELGRPSAVTGSQTAGGAQWAVRPGVRDEIAWSRTAKGIVLFITGSATPGEFGQLAAAVSG